MNKLKDICEVKNYLEYYENRLEFLKDRIQKSNPSIAIIRLKKIGNLFNNLVKIKKSWTT